MIADRRISEPSKRQVLIWGGGGHAKALRASFASANVTVRVVIERNVGLKLPFGEVVRFYGQNDCKEWLEEFGEGLEYAVAIGGHNGQERCRIATWLERFGLRPFTVVHPAAFVADTVQLGHGVQIMPMAALCEDVTVGDQTIVNTNASVDHDCVLGRGVHIMPGATIAGCVQISDFATVGSNATILPRLCIGDGAQIGAGAVVTKDVKADSVVIGVPARSV